MKWGRIVPCLVLLHSPDGSDILIETNSVTAIRPVVEDSEHVADGSRAIVYLVDKSFAVRESEVRIIEIIGTCHEKPRH